LALSALFLFPSPEAGALIRSQGEYWRKFQKAAELKEAGRIEEAMPLWAELSEASAELSAVRDYKNAGLFAKWLARALEERGRIEEARRWYAREFLYFELAGVPDWVEGDRARFSALERGVTVFVGREQPFRGPRAKYEPAQGAYLGFYAEGEPVLKRPGRPPAYGKVGELFGKKHALYLIYAHWGQPFPWGDLLEIAGAGGAAQISLEPDGPGGLEAVTDGPWLRQWLEDASSFSRR
jgi:tetratricopeptide (TPR) repeat protein